jgi:hypothetical protein
VEADAVGGGHVGPSGGEYIEQSIVRDERIKIMTRRITRTAALAVVPLTFMAAAGCTVAQAHEPVTSGSGTQAAAGQGQQTSQVATTAPPATATGTGTTSPSKGATATAPVPTSPAGRPGTVKVVRGTPVPNIRQSAAPAETSNFCDASDLPAGEGVANKGNTCVSTPIGEVAARPVRVTATTNLLATVGKPVKVKILVADNQGVLDLNAFTFDESGAAGKSLHEHPGELNEQGRPLAHCHLGVTTLRGFGALPGEDYDAAFSGIQGFKGDLTAEITGLPRGTYRGDVYCSGPGHPALTTNVATRVQAFDSFDFRVVGRR